MNWQLKIFEDLSKIELYKILQLRSKVFVVEQDCPYQDMDNIDFKAWHIFLEENEVMIAYARIMAPGDYFDNASIGRVIVDQSQRGNDLGKKLMIKCIEVVEDLYQTKEILISAQMYLNKFYSELGFENVGESYFEDNIPHIKMKFRNEKKKR